MESYGHHDRVMRYSIRLGTELSLDETELHSLELGALLHDIGKIGVPDSILRKNGDFTADELRKIQLHPLYGEEILQEIPFLEGAIKIVAQHHEWWNGEGYPQRLRGNEIDLKARIFSVIDAFDAMTSDRNYREAVSYEQAREEINRCSETQFDPLVVEAFCNVPKHDWEALFVRQENLKALTFHSFASEVVEKRTKDLLSEVHLFEPADSRVYQLL